MSELAAATPRPPASANGAPWRDPPDPRAVLRAVRVAAPADIDAAQLHDLSRSHTLTFAELPDGSAFVVKRISPSAHAAGRSLAAELYAYRLASWLPDLASALPQAVHLDERHQLLVLAAAPPEQLYVAQYHAADFPSAPLCRALGRALASVHATTAGVPLLSAASCGVVHLPDAPAEERGLAGGSAAAARVGDAVVADRELAATLRCTAAALRPSCLVHADLKWDNALLDPGPPARVRLFDWELSGRGDPAWDVGAALADTVTLHLRRGAALPRSPAAWLSPALRALLAAYAQHAPHEAGSDAFAARVAGCWIARTVHLALECASALDDPEHAVVRTLLDAARRLARAEAAVASAVEDSLAPQR